MTSVKAQQHLFLDDTFLDRVKYTNFLGVLIDENLTWKCHIDYVSKILPRNIGIMNKLKNTLFLVVYYILSFVLLFYLTLTTAYSYGEYM